VDIAGSGLCLIVGFIFRSVKLSGFSTRKFLIYFVLNHCAWKTLVFTTKLRKDFEWYELLDDFVWFGGYVCMYLCMYVRTYVCMYVCMYVYLRVYVCVCAHVFFACMYVCWPEYFI
jgi:hypothetical protein